MHSIYIFRGGSATVSKYRFGVYTVDNLWVEPEERGNGIARELMNRIIHDADKQKITLRLICVPQPGQNGLDYKELTAFYERCGFKQGEILHYWRQPKRAAAGGANYIGKDGSFAQASGSTAFGVTKDVLA